MANAASRLAASLLAALWLLQELIFVGPAIEWLGPLSLLLLAAFFVVGFLVARVAVRVVAAVALLLAGGLALRFGIGDTLLDGARSAVLFVAFLSTMQMLKVSLELQPGLERLRQENEALSARQQHDAMLLRSWLMASIFAAGTVALVAPLAGPDRDAAGRRLLAQSTLQGVGLALLWSPFFVAMAVCLKLSVGVTLSGALTNGLAMAFIGLTLSHLAFGGKLRLASIRPIWPVFAATAGMASIVIVLNLALGMGNSEAIVASVPLVALLMSHRALRDNARLVARRWHDALESIPAEALLVSASLVLGEVVKGLLAQGVIAMPVGMMNWPELLLIAWPALVMVALSVAGFHPIIGASLLFPLQGALPALHPLVAAGSVLTGWMLAVLLSTFAVPVMFAAKMFRVPARELVTGAGLRFSLMFSPSAWLYLWGLNHVLGAFP